MREGTIFSVDFTPDFFDAITLWDLFEHVPSPRALLVRVQALLKPGGFLFIETPNVNSLLDRVLTALARLGIKGPAITFYGLHHLTLWNPKTIRTLFNEVGLNVREIRASSTPARRIFRGKSSSERIMRLGVDAIQFVGKLIGRQNKMIIIAEK